MDSNFQFLKENVHLAALIARLNIHEIPFYIDICPIDFAITGECFANVQKQIEREGGALVLGWQFFEFDYMIEAQFHAVWELPDGQLIDITPNENPNTKQALFVIDKNRKYEGFPIDNARINTTSNELVDDIIEFEEAKFRFKNKIEKVDADGRLLFSDEEQQIWNELNYHAYILEQMYYAGCDINSQCCVPESCYNTCHRKFLKEFISRV